MKKENKVIQILLVVIGILVLILLGCFGYFMLKTKPVASLNDSSTFITETQEKPNETTSFDGIKIDLMDYLVFDLEDVDFRFVIAKVRIQSSNPINISLNHFKTSEGITLDSISTYVNTLEDKSLFLGKQNVVYDLISNESPYIANIFIPVQNENADSISVSNDIDNTTMDFLLKMNQGSSDMLAYKADDVITDGKTYQMKVSSAYEITGEYMYSLSGSKETEYMLPSTVAVYCFNLEATSLWGDTIEIEKAEYVPSTSSERFEALDSSIQSMKHSNILNQSISDNAKGSLFFVAFHPEDNPITYKGVLKLKVKDSSSWITINVDLN